MIHKGETIEKAVRNSGVSLTFLAKELKFSRRHIYNIFETMNVSTPLIIKIGKIISYDFSKDFSDLVLSQISNEQNYKEKYIVLLEKYNTVLEELNSLKNNTK